MMCQMTEWKPLYQPLILINFFTTVNIQSQRVSCTRSIHLSWNHLLPGWSRYDYLVCEHNASFAMLKKYFHFFFDTAKTTNDECLESMPDNFQSLVSWKSDLKTLTSNSHVLLCKKKLFKLRLTFHRRLNGQLKKKKKGWHTNRSTNKKILVCLQMGESCWLKQKKSWELSTILWPWFQVVGWFFFSDKKETSIPNIIWYKVFKRQTETDLETLIPFHHKVDIQYDSKQVGLVWFGLWRHKKSILFECNFRCFMTNLCMWKCLFFNENEAR